MADFHSYAPQDGHGLKYNPFKALIAPRPIGWLSTQSANGQTNLAPYSFFNAVSELPPMLGFTSYGVKDSLTNIRETGEFVHNLVPKSLVAEMNATSGTYPYGVSEIETVGLETLPSDLVAPPRLAAAPAALECKLIEIKHLHDIEGAPTTCHYVIGQVVRVHINRAFILEDGLIDEAGLALVGRLGYFNYAAVNDIFALMRPKV